MFYKEIIELREELMKNIKEDNYLDCIEVGESLIELQNQSTSTDKLQFSIDLFNIAIVYEELKMVDVSLEYYQRSNELAKEYYNTTTDFLDRLNNIALCHAKMGNYRSAMKQFIACEKQAALEFGKHSPQHLRYLYNMANINYDAGFYEECMDLHKKLVYFYGEDNNDLKIDSYNYMGYSNEKVGDGNNAILNLRKALTLIKKVHGTDSEEYIANAHYLAGVCITEFEYTVAAKLYTEVALKIRKHHGDKHPYYADILNKLADAYFKDGEIDKALKVRLKAVNLVKNQMGENHLYYANSLRSLAVLYKDDGQYEKTINLMVKALSIKAGLIGASNIDYIRDVLYLVNIFVAQTKYKKAIDMLKTTISLLDEDAGEFGIYIEPLSIFLKTIESMSMAIAHGESGTVKYEHDRQEVMDNLKTLLTNIETEVAL